MHQSVYACNGTVWCSSSLVIIFYSLHIYNTLSPNTEIRLRLAYSIIEMIFERRIGVKRRLTFLHNIVGSDLGNFVNFLLIYSEVTKICCQPKHRLHRNLSSRNSDFGAMEKMKQNENRCDPTFCDSKAHCREMWIMSSPTSWESRYIFVKMCIFDVVMIMCPWEFECILYCIALARSSGYTHDTRHTQHKGVRVGSALVIFSNCSRQKVRNASSKIVTSGHRECRSSEMCGKFSHSHSYSNELWFVLLLFLLVQLFISE